MRSPWGMIDSVVNYADGIDWVETPSHGGLRIRPDVAQTKLTKWAIAKGEKYGKYYWYEEDCDWAVALWELREIWPKFFHLTKREPESELLETLSAWRPDYLLDVGVRPLEEQYKRWMDWQEEQRMREEKHPDLIVSAFGDWDERVPKDCVGVYTADGNWHLVTKQSYDNHKTPNRLSNCELANETQNKT